MITSSTGSLTSRRSGVTISSWRVSAIGLRRSRLHLLGRLHHLFDAALQEECLLGNVVVLAVDDLLEAANGVSHLHILAGDTGELLGHVEGLREEALDLARARDRELLVFTELVDTENGD